MKLARRQLRRIIRKSLIKELTGYGPASRGEPGHRHPETGNWVDPGTPGYNPEKDDTLNDWGLSEYNKAIKAHSRKVDWGGMMVTILGDQVDPSWKHPAFR